MRSHLALTAVIVAVVALLAGGAFVALRSSTPTAGSAARPSTAAPPPPPPPAAPSKPPARRPPFVAEHKFTFQIALDPKMDVANAYGVRALPASFLVDRQGHLAALALGPRTWDNDAAHSLIEGLMSQ